MMAGDEASRAAGVTVVHVSPGRSEVSMRVTASMVNGHAIAHGGYIFLVADTAFAVACNSYGSVTVAAGCDIDFLRPAEQGEVLTAVAVERSKAGRSGLYDITVRRPDGTVVAEMRGRSRTVRGSLLDQSEGAADPDPEERERDA